MSKFAVAITKDTYTTQISTPEHMGLTDEPIALGGQNKGPTPYDLLIASLASCTSITLRMYCNRKKWDVSRIRVRVNFSRDYEEDCEGSCEDRDKVDIFERHISVEGSIDETQRARLLEIADKCPVHRTLERNAKIVSKIESVNG